MSSRNAMICTLGQYDIPIVQKQPLFRVDLLDKNIALFGAAMSGKTNFLKLLIQTLHMQYDEREEQIFILDLGGALASYKDLPLVSAYFDNSNEEYVKRTFRLLEDILKSNTKILGGEGYASCQGEKRPVHTTFLIDNLNAFQDEPRYMTYQEKFAKLCRDGLSKGITVVFTAADTKGINSYMNSFGQKIALEMPADKYLDIFGAKVTEIGAIPGRGFANVTVKPEGIEGTFRMNSPYELQCFLADPLEEGGDYLTHLHQKFGYQPEQDPPFYQKKVRKHLTFSGDLTRKEYERLRQEPKQSRRRPDTQPCEIAVGLDYVDFCPVTVDVSQSRVIGIYGKKEYGKTNLLRCILTELFEKKKDARFVFFDDGRKQLKEFITMCREKGIEHYRFTETVKKSEIPLCEADYKEEEILWEELAEVGGTAPFAQEKPAAPLSRDDLLSQLRKKSSSDAGTSDNFLSVMDGGPKQVSRKSVRKTFSPFQKFYHFLNDYYLDLTWNGYANSQFHSAVASYVYGEADAERMPPYDEYAHPVRPTVFVLQSKMMFVSAQGEKQFINAVLPKLVAVAEENDLIFLFTDIQKITDQETNNFFNNALSSVFLLDNIAEFASERGQKTVFGSMDAKSLKEEYARCELGDGYYYDIEADKLVKMKLIKTTD